MGRQASTDHHLEPRFGGVVVWVALSLAVLAAIALAVSWYANANERVFQPAADALEQGDFDQVRLSLSTLEGVAALADHRRLLEASLLVQGGDVDAARPALDALRQPDQPARLRSLAALTLGRAAQQAGEWRLAEDCFREALQQNPDSSGAREGLKVTQEVLAPLQRLDRALAAVRAGDEVIAKREWEAISADRRLQPFARLLRGAVLLHDQQYELSLQEFGHCVQHPLLRGRTLALSGEALYRMGRFLEAQAVLRQAVGEDDRNIEAHRWLAAWCFDQGANDHAEMHLKRVAELDPRDGRPDRLLGRMRNDFENYELAVEHYERALERELEPNVRREVLLELAQCRVKQRNYEGARTILLDSANGVVDDPLLKAAALTTLAECQLSLEGPEAAEQPLTLALEADPKRLEALLLQGALYEARGDREAAVDAYQRSVQVSPRDYTAQYRLAQALQRADRTQEAREAMQAAEEIKVLRTEFSELHQTAADNPMDASVRLRLGQLARQLALPIAAANWFKAVLALDPGNREALDGLTQLRQESATNDDAEGEAS